MVKKILSFLLIFVLIGLVAASCNQPNQRSDTIKVGALLILSGDFAKYGESSKNAIDLAVEKFNAQRPNGKTVEVIYEDTKADPKTALSSYQKLVSVDKVDVILGPLLQVEIGAIASAVAKDGIPVFSIASIPKENRTQGSNPLVIWPDPTLEAGQMAQYVYDQGARRIAIMGTRDSWEGEVSQAFSQKFESLGGTITANEIVLPNSTDARLPVTKAMQDNPDAVFLGTYYKFVYFVRTLGELGYKGKLYSIEIDSFLSEETKPFSDGLEFISPDFYSEDFIREFEQRYGYKPSLPSGQSHDAAQIMLNILSEHDDRSDILTAMDELRRHDGVSGTITFTAEHQAQFPLSIFRIQDGAFSKIK